MAGIALCFFDANAADEDSGTTKLDKVTVTGTRLPAAAAQAAQDVRVYDRERIERSGQATVPDFLATLPEVSLNSVESTYLATTVRLRGAVPGSALVLINGRRTEQTTGGAVTAGFFDLGTIPLS
ncbi:MAG TPA: TonB-dependent receptor plug domain-containing protein, partial [Burkholderiaceae bacterium]|nr:TonB-dependent receptor plug domain-containing protein [Burkholderiaceae bacterium]